MTEEAASLQERQAPPRAVVIFGASGDLTERKLVPALVNLVRHRRVAGSLTLIGVGRTTLSGEEFRKRVAFDPQTLAAVGLAGDVQYLGLDLDQEPPLSRRALLRGADRPGHRQHHALSTVEAFADHGIVRGQTVLEDLERAGGCGRT